MGTRGRLAFCLIFTLAVPGALLADGLHDELARADRELFEAAFVTCEAAKVHALVTDDIEFYHDQNGASFGDEVRQQFESLTANCPARQGVKRELVPGSLKVFPMKGGYAVQMGEHRFVQATERPATFARFVHLWQKKDGAWKLARVLSFDHHPETPAAAQPLVLGETFTIQSEVLKEQRRINVYLPPAYSAAADARLPVLYMPDGGAAEDFLHVAGLVQVLTGNGTMRPFVLVGIENTERRRDLTGPTESAEDRKIAPRVGGSAAFRAFLRDELIPQVERRYRTTKERAIVGESLAGLFVLETLVLEPELFDTYIAFDPSLWWNGGRLVDDARKRGGAPGRTLFVATSGDAGFGAVAERFMDAVRERPGWRLHYAPMPSEKHSTIYHPAALRAFRTLFAP